MTQKFEATPKKLGSGLCAPTPTVNATRRRAAQHHCHAGMRAAELLAKTSGDSLNCAHDASHCCCPHAFARHRSSFLQRRRNMRWLPRRQVPVQLNRRLQERFLHDLWMRRSLRCSLHPLDLRPRVPQSLLRAKNL